ncbi:MAG TPA: tRNA (adenosine(37)-N6)-dimethylallyltransferase MiaA [Bauldia sp.]|nr:tRNA (adenosine(37)-N6)-dimethylallyltransferase MiaA [Bauldia sp.]
MTRQTAKGSIVLLAGPTASGKSRLAAEMALARGGIVINADSMQVYRELRVLSARPVREEEAGVPHRLYGHVGAATRYSVGAWLADIAPVLAEAQRGQQPVVVVGGTGLYFKALTEGLATVPPIPVSVREAAAAEAAGMETEALHAVLAARDPEDAAAVRPSDRSRIARALEVFAATGRSLASWKAMTSSPPLVLPEAAERLVVVPDTAELHRRISARADAMVGAGGVEEAEALGALSLDPAMPAMKAIGVREFLAHLSGKLSLEEALTAIKTETRRYAKRQMTWIRSQMAGWSGLAG